MTCAKPARATPSLKGLENARALLLSEVEVFEVPVVPVVFAAAALGTFGECATSGALVVSAVPGVLAASGAPKSSSPPSVSGGEGSGSEVGSAARKRGGRLVGGGPR